MATKKEREGVAGDLMAAVRSAVYRRQRKLLMILKGKLVSRGGVTYRVIQVSRSANAVVVSDVKTSESLYNRMNAKAFLSKRIRILEEVSNDDNKRDDSAKKRKAKKEKA